MCEETDDDGRRCGKEFDTLQKLVQHRRSNNGGTHGKASNEALLVVAAQCPWCWEVFSTVAIARRHAKQSMARGYCGGRSFETVAITDMSVQCKMCDDSFETLRSYHSHIASHFRLEHEGRGSEKATYRRNLCGQRYAELAEHRRRCKCLSRASVTGGGSDGAPQRSGGDERRRRTACGAEDQAGGAHSRAGEAGRHAEPHQSEYHACL